MKWSRRHRTAAWLTMMLALALGLLVVRDGGMPRFPAGSGVVVLVVVAVALSIGLYFVRRRRVAG